MVLQINLSNFMIALTSSSELLTMSFSCVANIAPKLHQKWDRGQYLHENKEIVM